MHYKVRQKILTELEEMCIDFQYWIKSVDKNRNIVLTDHEFDSVDTNQIRRVFEKLKYDLYFLITSPEEKKVLITIKESLK